jgi:hypothetical protein
VTSCRTMSKKKVKKSEKTRFYGQTKLFILSPCPSTLRQF